MTDRELIYIKTIAECRSFSKAAKKLFMTQPSLSKCVSNIEAELGTPVFVRSTKGLTLTYAGECYCNAASQILNIYEDMLNEVNEIGELKHGRVRLGLTNYLSSWFLPHILPEYNLRYPDISISLMESDSLLIENALVANQIDFALLNRFEGISTTNQNLLDYKVLCTNPFVIVLPKESSLGSYSSGTDPITGLQILDPVYLKDQPFILGHPGQSVRTLDDIILEKAGIIPNIKLNTRNFDTARRLAFSGMGTTIVPWQYVLMLGLGDKADYFAIPPEYDAKWSFCVVTAKNCYLPKACQALIEICEAVTRKYSI